jgi:hypothetical protein
MRRSRLPKMGSAALSVVALVALIGCPGDDEPKGDRRLDENCKAAVARLVECCPGFDATRVDCVYEDDCEPSFYGCDYYTATEPAIDSSEARCVIEAPCEKLTTHGVCARAQEAKRPKVRIELGQAVDRPFDSECVVPLTPTDAGDGGAAGG